MIDVLVKIIIYYLCVSLALFILWCIRETMNNGWERQLKGITLKSFIYSLLRNLIILPIVSLQILWEHL